MRAFAIFVCILFYVTFSAAWPWPASLFVRDTAGRLVVRDDPPRSTSAAPASSAAQNTAAKTGTAAPTGSSSPSGTQSGSSPSSQPTGKDGDKKPSNQTVQTSSISIDPQSPVGGLSMINPASTSTTYYKYGTNITWVWNYTSLIVTPSAVNVIVSCQDTASTFTVAQNVSVNATQTVIWDTSRETGANITNKYTMGVFDAGNPAGVSATAEPGKLYAVQALPFAIYTRQPYQGYSDGYTCVTCNGALSSSQGQAFGFMVTMAVMTILSFSYFANGFMSL